HGQHRAARLARAQRQARVEALDDGLQLALDVGAGEALLVQRVPAALAEPGQRVQLVAASLALDHQPPGAGRTDRAVRRAGAHEHGLALAYRHVAERAARLAAAHGDVAGQLVEDLVAGIDVEVVARVRPAHDLVDELALREDLLV